MKLLLVSHRSQKQQADCLAACAAMVLDYLQVPTAYERLLRLLHVRAFGTAFRNIGNLRQLGLSVLVAEGDIQNLRHYLESGLPSVVAINTRQLPYWNEATDHAVVVVGLDEHHVFLNDPADTEAPKVVPILEFELAWLEKDYLYAVIQLES